MQVNNVGNVDRTIRMVVGTALFLVSATSNSIGLWGLIGIIPIITGFMRTCPLYSLLGINTCKLA